MNALERTLIEKAGYDNGWEVVIESIPDRVVLASALHRARATVTATSSDARWLLTLPAGPLANELARMTGEGGAHAAFPADSDAELGRLLRQTARLARSLPDLPEVRFTEAVARELAQSEPSRTEVEQLVRRRIGQDIYRQSLMDFWGGACAVTGIAIPELLRASHAKPWAECGNDSERLNVFNGLLLSVHLDALFDRHLMTFNEAGEAVFAPMIDTQLRAQLGLVEPLQLRRLSPEHQPFLAWHRAAFHAAHPNPSPA